MDYDFYQVKFKNGKFIIMWDRSFGNITKANCLIASLNKIYNLCNITIRKSYIRLDWLWRVVASFDEYCTVYYKKEILTNIPFSHSEINNILDEKDKNVNYKISKNYVLNGFILNKNRFDIQEKNKKKIFNEKKINNVTNY
jgi:hypothetical protein